MLNIKMICKVEERRIAYNILLSHSIKFAEKIQPVYEALKWTWTDKDGTDIPTLDNVIDIIHKLIYDLKKSEYNECSTGGLRVFINKDDTSPSGLICGIEFKYDDIFTIE